MTCGVLVTVGFGVKVWVGDNVSDGIDEIEILEVGSLIGDDTHEARAKVSSSDTMKTIFIIYPSKAPAHRLRIDPAGGRKLKRNWISAKSI